MDDFIDQVSDLVDFNRLNIYDNTVEWSGNLVKFDVEFLLCCWEKKMVFI